MCSISRSPLCYFLGVCQRTRKPDRCSQSCFWCSVRITLRILYRSRDANATFSCTAQYCACTTIWIIFHFMILYSIVSYSTTARCPCMKRLPIKSQIKSLYCTLLVQCKYHTRCMIHLEIREAFGSNSIQNYTTISDEFLFYYCIKLLDILKVRERIQLLIRCSSMWTVVNRLGQPLAHPPCVQSTGARLASLQRGHEESMKELCCIHRRSGTSTPAFRTLPNFIRRGLTQCKRHCYWLPVEACHNLTHSKHDLVVCRMTWSCFIRAPKHKQVWFLKGDWSANAPHHSRENVVVWQDCLNESVTESLNWGSVEKRGVFETSWQGTQDSRTLHDLLRVTNSS